MSEKQTTIRIMPMPVVYPIWEHDESDYPETIRVSFSNGHVRTYSLCVEQPKPITIDAQSMAHLMRKSTYGGSYKGKHEKK